MGWAGQAAVSERWQVIGQSLGDIQQERPEVLELGDCSLNYLISVQLQRERDREEGERLEKGREDRVRDRGGGEQETAREKRESATAPSVHACFYVSPKILLLQCCVLSLT